MDKFRFSELDSNGPEYFDVIERSSNVGLKPLLEDIAKRSDRFPYFGAVAEHLLRNNIIKSEEVRRDLMDRLGEAYDEQEFQKAWRRIKEQSQEATEQKAVSLAAEKFAVLLVGEKVKVIQADGSEVYFTKIDHRRFMTDDLNVRHFIYNAAEVEAMAGTQPPELVFNEDLRVKDRLRQDKLAQFEQLELHDRVVIGNEIYEKTGPEQFMASGVNRESAMTATVGFVKPEVLHRQIASSAQDPERVKFIHPRFGQRDLVEETPAELAELHHNFQAILPQLYPEANSYEKVIKHIRKSEIKQGGRGDCYLLAAINSLKKTDPELYYNVLARTIKRNEQTHSWEVTFQGRNLQLQPGQAEITRIIVTDEEIQRRQSTGASADLADIILERAYASLISRRKAGEAGHTMAVNQRMAFEGGFGHRALHDLLGTEVAQKLKIGESGTLSMEQTGDAEVAKHFLEQQFGDEPQDYIVTAGSLGLTEEDQPREYLAPSGETLYRRHAYSIVKYKNGQVFLETPTILQKPSN